MVWWMWWHCPPDTGTEIRVLEVWGRARYLSSTYLSVTEVPHNIESLRVSGEEIMPEWGSNPRSPTFQADSFNHHTRDPPLFCKYRLIELQRQTAVTAYLKNAVTAVCFYKGMLMLVLWKSEEQQQLTWKVSCSQLTWKVSCLALKYMFVSTMETMGLFIN